MPTGGFTPLPIIIELPGTKILEYFKTYFSIGTHVKAYMITGQKLHDFLTNRGANILSTDDDYAGITLLTYNANVGNFDNSATSTQKWVMPYPGLLQSSITISAMAYSKIAGVERIILRVTNSSIVPTFGYPGITSGGGGGGIGGTQIN